ncbi:MAG TPA: FadR/GntR family transcriptional regulator [Steroidobacteraceae bacterium]|nr:FadR/GntR family transcriptional regulator [Steroidobacteraceae bacterium]
MNARAHDRPLRQSQPRPMPRLSRLALERARSAHDQIAATLGTELLRGAYAPGSNMPPEPQLIERFQISRTVMREVMKTLAAKGFVISKTKVGTRVRDPVYWNYFDADVLAWRVRLGLDDEFMLCLTEVRRALEPAAAALAAQRRSSADLDRLRECVRDMARPNHTRQTFAEADLDFHLAIGSASGNPLMRSMASVIETALVASFAHSSPVDDPADHEATVNGHAAIVDAIEAGAQRAAAQAILKVIDIGVSRIEGTRKKQRGPQKK